MERACVAGNDAASWMQTWQASSEWEEIYDRNRFAAAKFSWQPRLCNPRLARWLHRVRVPVHVVWGDQDRIIPPAYANAFRDLLPEAKLTLIPDAGHLPHVERAEAALAAMRGFMAETGKGPTP